MSLKLPAIRFIQKGTTMFLAALPVAELDLCRIDTWDPKKTGKWKGYHEGIIEKQNS